MGACSPTREGTSSPAAGASNKIRVIEVAPLGECFRITVKKDMCISCGNCSTYCEMGIDVRQYAMANQSFTRASCVGCGLCAHVCPRGVLKLENKPIRWKAGQPIRVYAVDL